MPHFLHCFLKGFNRLLIAYKSSMSELYNVHRACYCAEDVCLRHFKLSSQQAPIKRLRKAASTMSAHSCDYTPGAKIPKVLQQEMCPRVPACSHPAGVISDPFTGSLSLCKVFLCISKPLSLCVFSLLVAFSWASGEGDTILFDNKQYLWSLAWLVMGHCCTRTTLHRKESL